MIKRLLSAELRMWHFLLVGVLLLGSGTGVLGAPANSTPRGPDALDSYLAAGQFRMAMNSSISGQTVSNANGWTEVLRVSFTVPAGQKAGIAAFFNAKAYKYPDGYCYARFELEDGTVLSPNNAGSGQWVVDGQVYSGAYPTLTDQGYRLAVPAGTHAVIVKLMTTGGDCTVYDRSLIVIANQR